VLVVFGGHAFHESAINIQVGRSYSKSCLSYDGMSLSLITMDGMLYYFYDTLCCPFKLYPNDRLCNQP